MLNGLIRRCRTSRVAANLLMLVMLLAGLAAIAWMPREDVPRPRPDRIVIPITWPDATADALEGRVVAPLERSLDGLPGAKRVRSQVWDGGALIEVVAVSAERAEDLMRRVDAAAAGVADWPAQVGAPRPRLVDPDPLVIEVAVTGALDLLALRREALSLREALLTDPEIGLVEVVGGSDLEWLITADPQRLVEIGMTPDEFASAIDAGLVPTAGGRLPGSSEVRIAPPGAATSPEALRAREIPTTADAAPVTVADLATVTEVPARHRVRASVSGQPAVLLHIRQGPDQDIMAIADAVQQVTAAFNADQTLVQAQVSDDRSRDFRARIEVLALSGITGAGLVLLVLLLFLPWRTAWWIAAGIPIAVLGGLALAWWWGVGFNAVSLFALLVAIGLVVDDAIIIGDGIERGRGGRASGLGGAATRLARPVIAAGLTTMLAFAPFQLVPGQTGDVYGVVSTTVILVLIASLVECLLILPRHLSGRHQPGLIGALLDRLLAPLPCVGRGLIDGLWRWLVGPTVRLAVRLRYLTLGMAGALAWVAIGLLFGDRVGTDFFPKVASSTLTASVELPVGAGPERTQAVLDQLISGARRALEGPGSDAGIDPRRAGIVSQIADPGRAPHRGSVRLSVPDLFTAEISPVVLAEAWREAVGDIPNLRRLAFSAGDNDDQIAVALTGPPERVRQAALLLADGMRGIEGVVSVTSTAEPGIATMTASASQDAVASGWEDAQVADLIAMAAGGRDIGEVAIPGGIANVRLRLGAAPSTGEILSFPVVTPSGHSVPLGHLSVLEWTTASGEVTRRDGRRVVEVAGVLDEALVDEDAVEDAVEEGLIPDVLIAYPDVTITPIGEVVEKGETLGGLALGGGLAVIGIYLVLVWARGGWLSPLLVMSVIPLAFCAVVLGHWALGLSLSLLSLLGILAVFGVAVNDSLVLIQAVDGQREAGDAPIPAIITAARQRLRAIVVTTLTTCIGLVPLLTASDEQAQFLTPMAWALCLGVAAGTALTLVVVPCLLAVSADLAALVVWRPWSRSRIEPNSTPSCDVTSAA